MAYFWIRVACFPDIARVLKPHNFVAVSPSRQQVAGQAAMESIPLVFEPQSRFYTSPVVVLDFQVCARNHPVKVRQ